MFRNTNRIRLNKTFKLTTMNEEISPDRQKDKTSDDSPYSVLEQELEELRLINKELHKEKRQQYTTYIVAILLVKYIIKTNEVEKEETLTQIQVQAKNKNEALGAAINMTIEQFPGYAIGTFNVI